MKRSRKNRSNACKQGEQVGRVDKKCGISGGGKKAGKCKNICTPGRSPSLLPSCSHSPLILFGIFGIEHILGSIPTPCRPKPRPISRNIRRREVGREVQKHLLPCLLLIFLLFLVDLLLLVSLVYFALLVILLLLYSKNRNWM